MAIVESNIKEFSRYMTDVEKRQIPWAVKNALNKSNRRIGTEAKRDISKNLAVAQKHISTRLFKEDATRQHLGASQTLSKRFIKAIKLGKTAKQTKTGVSIGRKYKFKGDFIATMKNGKRGIFYRSSRTVRRSKDKRTVKQGKTAGQEYRAQGKIIERGIYITKENSGKILHIAGDRVMKHEFGKLLASQLSRKVDGFKR